MKELTLSDLGYAFEQDVKMALYTLDRYNIEANLTLVACDDYDVDKAHLIETLRKSDIAKKVNDHYIIILFTFVDHDGARCALQKLLTRYHQYNLLGSLIALRKGESCERAFERLLEANAHVHQDPHSNIFYEIEHSIEKNELHCPAN